MATPLMPGVVPVHAQPLVSDDLSQYGDSIRRMRISFDDISGIGAMFGAGSERAELVNLADVEITCVPRKWTQERSLALPEIPWEEDSA